MTKPEDSTRAGKECGCKDCRRMRTLQPLIDSATPEQQKAFESLLLDLEDAETSLGWLNGKADDGEELVVGHRHQRRYLPKRPNAFEVQPQDRLHEAIYRFGVSGAKGLAALMSDEERLDFFSHVREGFCQHCGAKLGDYPCPCLRDE